MIFRYRWDSAEVSDWSDWTEDLMDSLLVQKHLLEEGDHVFEAQAGYSARDFDSKGASLSFVVNALAGSSLRLSPRDTSLAQNTPFSIRLMAEEVSDLMAVKAVIKYDPDWMSATSGNYAGNFLEQGEGVLWSFDPDIDEEAGIIEINMARGGGTTRGVSGTGLLATIELTTNSKSGTTQITIQDAELRDAAGDTIEVHQKIGTRVVVLTPELPR